MKYNVVAFLVEFESESEKEKREVEVRTRLIDLIKHALSEIGVYKMTGEELCRAVKNRCAYLLGLNPELGKFVKHIVVYKGIEAKSFSDAEVKVNSLPPVAGWTGREGLVVKYAFPYVEDIIDPPTNKTDYLPCLIPFALLFLLKSHESQPR